MWVLDAISEYELRKPLLILGLTLGAGFLLLAYFFSVNPLAEPLIYVLVALDLSLMQTQKRHPLRVALLLAGVTTAGYWLLAAHSLLFTVIFSFLAGFEVYRQSFRWWRWLVSAALLFVSLHIIPVWQQMLLMEQIVPQVLLPLAHSLLFSFCMLISFLVYSLRKDPVEEAVDNYTWKTPSEPATMVHQTRDLYKQLRTQIPQKDAIRQELREFAEKTVHLCYHWQQLSIELAGSNPDAVEQQIVKLKETLDSTTDPPAKNQYEKALENRRKQREQFQRLKLQAERLRAQIFNTTTALENMRFAYANREFANNNDNAETIEFFVHMATTRTDNVSETSEAYQRLLAQD